MEHAKLVAFSIEARALAEPDFDRKEFQEWLKGHPPEVAVALASRAALRVFPIVRRHVRVTSVSSEAVFLSLFRANFLACGFVDYRLQTRVRRSAADNAAAAASRAARAARDFARAANSRSSARVAGFIANAASDAATTAYAASPNADIPIFAAAAHAAAAALSANMVSTDTAALSAVPNTDFAVALRSECEIIDAGLTALDLARTPLWLNGISEELGWDWKRLSKDLLALDPNWSVWTDCYDDRLAGRPADLEFEIARANLPEELWDKGAKAVNAELARIRDELRAKRSPASEPEEAADQSDADNDTLSDEALAQGPGVLHFAPAESAMDVAHVTSVLSVPEATRDALHEGLIELLREVLKEDEKARNAQRNHDFPARLEQSLRKLIAFLESEDGKQGGAVLHSSRRFVTRVAELIREGGTGLTELDDPLNEAVEALAELKACYPEITKIERDRLRNEITARNQDRVVAALDRMTKTLEARPDALPRRRAKSSPTSPRRRPRRPTRKPRRTSPPIRRRSTAISPRHRPRSCAIFSVRWLKPPRPNSRRKRSTVSSASRSGGQYVRSCALCCQASGNSRTFCRATLRSASRSSAFSHASRTRPWSLRTATRQPKTTTTSDPAQPIPQAAPPSAVIPDLIRDPFVPRAVARARWRLPLP
ncbi:hypothetical protein LC092_04605 [Stappia stellulata]|uniref:hypothetical protein n=1 Tax=Stappia stellulata TaxID=71235 RepID=UPI001CD54B47|nr:hypothetical protein [Stappia stellulata]MCA1241706.1 hypothetical protein [Stappia stellulata]